MQAQYQQPHYQNTHEYPVFDDATHLSGSLHGKSRMGFIRKVYGIVFAQLALSAIWVATVYNSSALTKFVVESTGLGYLFAFITFVGTLTLALSRTTARTVPVNYLLLGAVTFSTAWSVSFLCAFFPANTVVLAAVATASAVGGITLYSLTSNSDYSWVKAFAYSTLFILAFQLFAIFFMPREAYNFWVSVLFAISSCIAILYHAEKIIGKKDRKYSQDDYIYAAMNLYIEIVQLFIEILRILDKLNKDKEENDKKKKRDS